MISHCRHDSVQLIIKNYVRSASFLFTVCGIKTHKVTQDARFEIVIQPFVAVKSAERVFQVCTKCCDHRDIRSRGVCFRSILAYLRK